MRHLETWTLPIWWHNLPIVLSVVMFTSKMISYLEFASKLYGRRIWERIGWVDTEASKVLAHTSLERACYCVLQAFYWSVANRNPWKAPFLVQEVNTRHLNNNTTRMLSSPLRGERSLAYVWICVISLCICAKVGKTHQEYLSFQSSLPSEEMAFLTTAAAGSFSVKSKLENGLPAQSPRLVRGGEARSLLQSPKCYKLCWVLRSLSPQLNKAW